MGIKVRVCRLVYQPIDSKGEQLLICHLVHIVLIKVSFTKLQFESVVKALFLQMRLGIDDWVTGVSQFFSQKLEKSTLENPAGQLTERYLF